MVKREHKKSRLGCANCKRRRIKCDERPPCCGPCSRKGLECDYKDIQPIGHNVHLLTPSDFSGETSASVKHRALSRYQEPHSSLDAEVFTLDDLALMHHWTLSTASTVGAIDDEQYHSIWQSKVPRLAQTYRFLVHAVLSTAAMHLALTDSPTPVVHMKLGEDHYTKALESFTKNVIEVNGADPQLSDAVWCFSVLIMHISFAMGQVNSSSGQDAIEVFASILQSIRSASSVLTLLRDSPPDSAVSRLLQHTRHGRPHSLAADVSHSLHHLHNMLDSEGQNFDQQTLASLDAAFIPTRNFFTLVPTHPSSWAHVLRWPFSLDPAFFLLLQQRNPVALALLAHWCVPIHNAPKRWSVGEWPRIVMEEIRCTLNGTGWESGIEWPCSEILLS